MRILVTGASGYIGGRLVPALLEEGHDVRCLSRNPAKLADDPWFYDVETVQGDVLDLDSLDVALAGCDAAYYLVHSMDGSSEDFRERDRRAADNFRAAADRAGLRRIVYLGGLGQGDDLSKHLSSRQEVGALLAAGRTPVTELRAAVIIGSGSVSFEMVRYLTEVLPAMVTPKWVRTRCQPIAIRNVLEILTGVLEAPDDDDHVHEIGGPDVLTYEDMMREYAEVAGLRRRLIVPVPVLTPQLSSLWVGLVTPLPAGVARPLVDSLRNEVVVTDNSIAEKLSSRLVPYAEAVALALRHSEEEAVVTRWSDSSTTPAQPLPGDPEWSGGTLFVDTKVEHSAATPEDVFWAFSRIGGDTGYYTYDWAWALRGILDSLVGGVGLRRGRRHPEDLNIGESLDFWRVAAVEPGRLLQLYAEMRLPGEAWLQWETAQDGDGARLEQKAVFLPRGLLGRAYWYALAPFHHAIFGRMARRIADEAERRTRDGEA